MLYIWTDASILTYVKLLSYAKDLIPDILGNAQIIQNCRNIESVCVQIFLANAAKKSIHSYIPGSHRTVFAESVE